jgi:hypothetical protein
MQKTSDKIIQLINRRPRFWAHVFVVVRLISKAILNAPRNSSGGNHVACGGTDEAEPPRLFKMD